MPPKTSPESAPLAGPLGTRLAADLEDVSAFPNHVKTRVGAALWDARDRPQRCAGGKAPEGFGDAGVLEVVVDFDANTFRTVYTVRFSEAVYVLHAFQKKSRRAIATLEGRTGSHRQTRLSRAKEDYEEWRTKPLIPVTPSWRRQRLRRPRMCPSPKRTLAKAQLAQPRLRRSFERRRLTQVAAAAVILDVDQPKVSALLRRGELPDFSLERLVRFLDLLGQDVQIVVKSKPRRRRAVAFA